MLSTFFIVIVTHKTQTFQHVSVEHDVTNMEDDRKKKIARSKMNFSPLFTNQRWINVYMLNSNKRDRSYLSFHLGEIS